MLKAEANLQFNYYNSCLLNVFSLLPQQTLCSYVELVLQLLNWFFNQDNQSVFPSILCCFQTPLLCQMEANRHERQTDFQIICWGHKPLWLICTLTCTATVLEILRDTHKSLQTQSIDPQGPLVQKV